MSTPDGVATAIRSSSTKRTAYASAVRLLNTCRGRVGSDTSMTSTLPDADSVTSIEPLAEKARELASSLGDEADAEIRCPRRTSKKHSTSGLHGYASRCLV